MTSSGDVSPSSITPSTTPLGSHAPKYGTVIPNRVFVGGIVANTTEAELKQYFSSYGAVKDTKIIADRAGVSKGYGFVTFETQEDADKLIKKESENLMFKDRKLNIGPAIRKQTFPRVFDPSISPGPVMFTNGVPYTFQNGMAFFSPQETAQGYIPTAAQTLAPTVQHPSYPLMTVPQAHAQPTMYVPQASAYAAYQAQAPAAAASTPSWPAGFRWPTAQAAAATVSASSLTTQTLPAQYMYPTMLPTADMFSSAQAYQHELPEGAVIGALEPTAHATEGFDGTSVQASELCSSSVENPPSPLASSIASIATISSYHPLSPKMRPILVAPGPSVNAHAAYKRPLPMTPVRKIVGTALSLSPHAQPPPHKYIIGPGQRLVPKMEEPNLDYSSFYPNPLTPPSTPARQ